MPHVHVHLFAAARAAIGASELSVEADTLGNLCDVLTSAHPDFSKVRQQCSYLVNEVASHGNPYSVELQPGDRVDVLPPFAGGSQ
jgi:molybdopterin synthase sulfur carrier subunit